MSERTARFEPGRRSTQLVVMALGAWVVVASTLGAAGAFGQARPLIPLAAFGAVALLVFLYRRRGMLREVADRVPLWVLSAIHIVRAPIGALLLWDMWRGNLPALFARRAGPGDILVGVLAIGVAALLARGKGRVLALAWNVLGLLDLALAFGTAQYLFFVAHDPRMTAVGSLPYAFLPSLIVPFMIATHLLMIVRLSREVK